MIPSYEPLPTSPCGRWCHGRAHGSVWQRTSARLRGYERGIHRQRSPSQCCLVRRSIAGRMCLLSTGCSVGCLWGQSRILQTWTRLCEPSVALGSCNRKRRRASVLVAQVFSSVQAEFVPKLFSHIINGSVGKLFWWFIPFWLRTCWQCWTWAQAVESQKSPFRLEIKKNVADSDRHLHLWQQKLVFIKLSLLKVV